MVKNPINTLFLIGILFWLPQMTLYRKELTQNQKLLSFITSNKMAEVSTVEVGAAKISGVVVAGSQGDSDCLIRYLKVSELGPSGEPGRVVFELQKLTPNFQLQQDTSLININTQKMILHGQPPSAEIQFQAPQPIEQLTPFFAKWDISEPGLQKSLSESRVRLAQQEFCLPYGENVFVTGYLNDKRSMAYTVTVPFALLYGAEVDIQKMLVAAVSKNYFGAAVVFMMIASLGLAIMMNSLLRGRINLAL